MHEEFTGIYGIEHLGSSLHVADEQTQDGHYCFASRNAGESYGRVSLTVYPSAIIPVTWSYRRAGILPDSIHRRQLKIIMTYLIITTEHWLWSIAQASAAKTVRSSNWWSTIVREP